MNTVDTGSPEKDLAKIQIEADRLSRGSQKIKDEVKCILASNIGKLNKLVWCGVFFRRLDYFRKWIEGLWGEFDAEQFAKKYPERIYDFFDFLAKGKRKVLNWTESWFSWFIEIEWMHLIYKVFWEHIDLDKRVRAIYYALLTTGGSYIFARKMQAMFTTMDLTQETKKWFDNFISKVSFNYLDISMIIYRDFSWTIDLSQEIIKNEAKIISFFKRAWKAHDIERLAKMMECYWGYIDFKPLAKEIFSEMLKSSYNKSFDFWRYVKDSDISDAVRNWFAHRFANKEFKMAKQIIKDFWEWIDFTEDLLAWISYLESKWTYMDKEETLKDFLHK
ncbi:MAG: hypothetical protein ACD_2C00084G0001 [uncultured bacterium (gcode 4)]|uniref:Uncharacterized protein n=1 Tax=uncultured bacterium (gcode 4) TaxID=1234023 RepID=K2FF88_9BACT|nr:MAG: hypothetical protein ACD_2C00084G0001 [uncultured bacterium (gcode 4)]